MLPAKCRNCPDFIAFLDGTDGPGVKCKGENGAEYVRRIKTGKDGLATADCKEAEEDQQ
jgi:hypothetical protein